MERGRQPIVEGVYQVPRQVTNVQRFGMKFHTRAAAEKARDQMRRAKLIRYLVSTMQDLDEGT